MQGGKDKVLCVAEQLRDHARGPDLLGHVLLIQVLLQGGKENERPHLLKDQTLSLTHSCAIMPVALTFSDMSSS